MPTGHSSGGSSSHSGGSFGEGSSHSVGGGGRMWHGRPMPHGPGIVIINNRPYRMSGGASAGFFVAIILTIVCFFAIFAGGFMTMNAASTKSKIEYDFVKYQDMVEFAKKDENRIVDGTIKSIEPGYGKFRIIYEFKNRYGKLVEGYTFYVYDKEYLEKYEVGEEIEIALDLSYLVEGEPDSIPTDFVNFEVGDDGEYIHAQTQQRVGLAILFCGIVGAAASFVVAIVVRKKFAKPYEENEPTPSPASENKKEEDEFCAYCGARLKKGEHKCPECGANN